MKTYFIFSPATQAVKIGRAIDPEARLRGFSTGNADDLRLLGVLDGDCEREMHRRFSSCRRRGEWFVLGPELSDFLKANFHAVFPTPRRPGPGRAVVEPWTEVVNRAEALFGCGLRQTEWLEFWQTLYDGLLHELHPLHEEGEVEATSEQPADESLRDRDELDEFEAEYVLHDLERHWEWVRGWNFVPSSPGDCYSTLHVLFQKPSSAPQIEKLLRAIAVYGDISEGDPNFRLNVGFCWRVRTELNEWLGEIIGPGIIDDGPQIATQWGTPAEISVDGLLDFKVLGDAWYVRGGLQAPSEVIAAVRVHA